MKRELLLLFVLGAAVFRVVACGLDGTHCGASVGRRGQLSRLNDVICLNMRHVVEIEAHLVTELALRVIQMPEHGILILLKIILLPQHIIVLVALLDGFARLLVEELMNLGPLLVLAAA